MASSCDKVLTLIKENRGPDNVHINARKILLNGAAHMRAAYRGRVDIGHDERIWCGRDAPICLNIDEHSIPLNRHMFGGLIGGL